MADENQRMKFENILSKKVKELEVLSESLVYKEQELLVKYRDQLEETDLEENLQGYEKRGLLDEDDDDDSESDNDYNNKNRNGYNHNKNNK